MIGSPSGTTHEHAGLTSAAAKTGARPNRRQAASAANRREGEADRRMADPDPPAAAAIGRANSSLSANLPVWALVVGLIVVAALVAVLVAVFGAVNPVAVRLR